MVASSAISVWRLDMRTQRCVIDNRIFLVALDDLYRATMKEHERHDLLSCG